MKGELETIRSKYGTLDEIKMKMDVIAMKE